MWDPAIEPPHTSMGTRGVLHALFRGLPLAVLTFGGLAVLLCIRILERPIYGLHRPLTPFITQFVCRSAFIILGLSYATRGERMAHPGIVVSNHVSWLDIFALNARKRIYFVSKAEVAKWPGIGWLARATGTVFINRDPKEAKTQQTIFKNRLLAGHKLLFFPEGTSTDGRRVLPFKPTLLQSLFDPDLRDNMYVQPVTLVYRAPRGADPRFYGWWGDMDFAPHLLQTLAAHQQGGVTVIYHAPVKVDAFKDRKRLSAHLEHMVRSGLPADLTDG